MLTKNRTKALTQAYKMAGSNEHVNFVFADVNGNLKFRLNEPSEHNKYTYMFHASELLEKIFEKLAGIYQNWITRMIWFVDLITY